MGNLEGASFAETPTWAVATVVTVLVSIGFLIHGSLKKFGKVRKKDLSFLAVENFLFDLLIFFYFLFFNFIIMNALLSVFCSDSGCIGQRGNLFMLH